MTLSAGARLGPYEILELVGAGGMGEVYRARDPRLGREVAVKVLPTEVASDPDRLARFEREARAVAALNHPNILTVFDVGTSSGDAQADASSTATAVPYVVTELLQGETLREMVSHRAPSQRQVLGFAVQIAQGLDAAHAKGIVHRDIKPENVFLTTDGRVKILDFGLAKPADRLTADSVEATESSPTGAGQVVGTIGYMSPEQVRGLPIDHRTDVFSFGVLLYELLSGRHPFRRETTVGTLTAILEDAPAELSSLSRGVPPALSGIVGRCLEKDREQRFRSAHDLALSLEAVLAAPAGSASLQEVEEKSPYPGLASFTEKDAAQFFGREAEVRALWQRLQTRRLLAVIAPSGAGKTSFLRAGVIPARPEGWGAVCATPGARPALGLAQSLTPELAGDAEAVSDLLRGVTELIESGESERGVAAVKRWRSRHGEALLVIDQFEELFTLSAKETQQRFAALVGRLASEADVHVVLSLRDDFLIRCSEHEPLFDETTLYTSGWAGLRRWDLERGTSELVAADVEFIGFLDSDRRLALTGAPVAGREMQKCGQLQTLDLASGATKPVGSFGACLGTWPAALSGEIAAVPGPDGVLVGRLSGDAAQLLVGHEGPIRAVAVSPDGRWVATSGEDNTLRLWPMPDLTKPPLHTLPHDELLAKLKSLTNLRVVRDPKSQAGWRIHVAPFPGWKDVPTW
jgi:eukaryotic-like serine/threonine-protein kinase